MLEPYWNTNYAYHHSHRQQFDYLNLDHIAKHLVFINDGSLKIHQGQIESDVDLIRRSRQQTGRLPVLTLDSNPYDVESYVNKLNLYLDSSEYFVFNSDIRESQSTQRNVAPWPSWLLFQHHTPEFQNFNKTKRISFLSGIPRLHRLKLFQKIKSLVRHNDVVVINKFCNVDPTLPPEWIEQLPWSNCNKYLDTPQTEYTAYRPETNAHPGYQACVNITGETLGYGDQVLPSEKTWKAYRSGCLVVNYGVENMVSTLENFGLWIWHDYDQNISAENKIQKCEQLFQRDDIFDLYTQNLEMIRYNKNLIMSREFCLKLASAAVAKLQSIL
jgi:hypothetical protein